MYEEYRKKTDIVNLISAGAVYPFQEQLLTSYWRENVDIRYFFSVDIPALIDAVHVKKLLASILEKSRFVGLRTALHFLEKRTRLEYEH